MPGRTRMHYIIAYDVTDDGKRTKLANLLLGYGNGCRRVFSKPTLSRRKCRRY